MKKDEMHKHLLLVGLAAAGVYLYTQGQKKTIDDVAEVTVPVVPPPTYKYPISYGKYHPDAKLLQATLHVQQDGIIGPQTIAAWQKYWPSVSSIYEIESYPVLQDCISYIVRKQMGGVAGFRTLG